jgi:hypothetical protein
MSISNIVEAESSEKKQDTFSSEGSSIQFARRKCRFICVMSRGIVVCICS